MKDFHTENCVKNQKQKTKCRKKNLRLCWIDSVQLLTVINYTSIIQINIESHFIAPIFFLLFIFCVLFGIPLWMRCELWSLNNRCKCITSSLFIQQPFWCDRPNDNSAAHIANAYAHVYNRAFHHKIFWMMEDNRMKNKKHYWCLHGNKILKWARNQRANRQNVCLLLAVLVE